MANDSAAIDRVTASMQRQMAAMKQMVERTGPIYEIARERSRMMHAAWRAAGSPPHVHQVRIAGGCRYVTWTRAADPATWKPATDAEVKAWYTWWRERDRLRRGLRGSPTPSRSR
jgi:hypothetical protein